MSLLSNPNPTRVGIYQSWLSNWYENNPVYSSLVYTDLYVNEFLNGIYYKLKMPSSLPTIRDLGYQTTIIYIQSFLFLKKFKNRKFLNFYLFNKIIKARYRKMLLLFKRSLKNIKKYEKKKINNVHNKNYKEYCVNNLFNSIKNMPILFNGNNKMNDNIKLLYNMYYKLYNNRKNKFFVKKKILNYKKKHINIFNKEINKKLINISNNKKILNNFFLLKKNRKNNIYLFNIINRYNTRRKLQNYLYKLKIKKIRNYRINKIRRKKSRHRIFFRKIFFGVMKKKYKKIYNRFELTACSNINKFILLFQWLLYKLSKWFHFLVIQSFFIFFIFSNINNHLYKKDNFVFNIFKNNISVLKIIKLCNLLYHNNVINYLSLVKIVKHSLFTDFISKEKKLINLAFKKKNYNYSRIKSYYRLRKKRIRDKKRKEYELKYNPKILTLHYRLLSTTKKGLKLYFNCLYYKQLNLKINNTLKTYLSKPIFFLNRYNRFNFNRLGDPKLLGDYIKLMMKYENKNPTILKKIVKFHSSQRTKCRRRTYFLMNKLLNLTKRINIKLYFFSKKYNLFFNHSKQYIKKKKRNILFTTKKEMKYYINKYKYISINKKKNANKVINKKWNTINILDNSQREKVTFDSVKIKIKKKLNFMNNKIKYSNSILSNKISRQSCIYTLNNWKFKFRDLAYKRYPLIGIRIECNGPTKKGRRTQTHLYNEWVDFYRLPGKMPLVTIMSDIRYWQTYGLTQRASIGIKLWMYFHSPFYSEFSKKVLNKE